jgi:hypothetical protein
LHAAAGLAGKDSKVASDLEGTAAKKTARFLPASFSEPTCPNSKPQAFRRCFTSETAGTDLADLFSANPKRAAIGKIHRMTLIDIVLVLVVAGLILWLIDTYVPMAGGIKSLLNVVVFVVLLIWVLQVFGLIGAIPVRVPPLR